MNKHIHGGKIFEAARDLNLPWTEILDFSANINPLGQPKGLKKHLFNSFAETVHYPEIAASSLSKAISESTGLPEEAILPGAGSTPHIRMLASLFSPGKFVIIGPAFAEYEESLIAADNPPLYVLARPEDDFIIDLKVAEKAVSEKPKALILANPANPTGRLVPEETLSYLVEKSEEEGFRLIIDEAFIDFTTRETMERLVLTSKNLLILRSLTKIYAIPGLRLAYLAGHPDFIKIRKVMTEPWPINSMALEAGLHSVPQKAYREETRLVTSRLRTLLSRVLSPLGDLIPSDSNFILLKVRKGTSIKLLSHLYNKGILARDASNFKGLGEGYLRFAVRPRGEIQKLHKALKDYHA